MPPTRDLAQTLRFGVFEVDLLAGELRKRGVRIALQEKPLQVLAALLSHAGQAVTRDELREALWDGGTFVDFDHSINIAISKLRQALGDSGKNPRFIETVSRHGYRFIAPVSHDAPPVSPPRRILMAVLPFEDLSGDGEQSYFIEGLTEEMIAQLGRVAPRTLGVIARTTAMQYRGTALRIDQIGEQLGVDYILEGSLRRTSSRVRITAKLIQVANQAQLWAETYDRALSDVVDIQRTVARRIARSLAVELVPEQPSMLSRRFTRNAAAHESYLRGRYFLNRRTEDSFAKAVQYFEDAIREDDRYALAYAGLAATFDALGLYGGVAPEVARLKAREGATKALEIDDQLGEAHTALAYATALFEWDWIGAENRFRTAIEYDPNHVMGRHWYAHFLVMMQRFDEALAQMRLALDLDPLSVVLRAHTGWVLYFARRFDEARQELTRACEMDPSFALARYFLGLTWLQAARFDDAIRQFETADQISPGHPAVLAGMGQAFAAKGSGSEARRMLVALSHMSARRHVSPYFHARVHLGLGETQAALDSLQAAFAQRCPWMAFLNVDPAVDPLRGDAGFRRLLRRIGFVSA